MNKFSWPEAPSHSAFPVASAGYPFILFAAFTTAVFALLGLTVAALAGLVATFFLSYFFRDPDRVVPGQSGAVVSPADGKVIVVKPMNGSPVFNENCLKISIFMSVFNVHVNRIPHEGTVSGIKYHPGRFLVANRDKASRLNEQNAILLETSERKKICVVQVAGLVARRIICRIREGDTVSRGQRFGMICFGSRLDVYLPADATPNVGVGDRVKAGTSILGFIK